jgi:hypothetical protein
MRDKRKKNPIFDMAYLARFNGGKWGDVRTVKNPI